MPDRFIYNLGIIYGIQEESSWDTIDKLCVIKKLLHSEGTNNLKKASEFCNKFKA
jgi:hypothetical protein